MRQVSIISDINLYYLFNKAYLTERFEDNERKATRHEFKNRIYLIIFHKNSFTNFNKSLYKIYYKIVGIESIIELLKRVFISHIFTPVFSLYFTLPHYVGNFICMRKMKYLIVNGILFTPCTSLLHLQIMQSILRHFSRYYFTVNP